MTDLAIGWTVDDVPESSLSYLWLTDLTGFPFWMITADGDVNESRSQTSVKSESLRFGGFWRP